MPIETKLCQGCGDDTPLDSLYHGEMYGFVGDFCEGCVMEHHRQIDAMIASHIELL